MRRLVLILLLLAGPVFADSFHSSSATRFSDGSLGTVPWSGRTPTVLSNSATNFFTGLGTYNSATSGEGAYVAVVSEDGTFSRLRCVTVAAPGGSASYTLTLRVNLADSDLTCAISAANTTCDDLVNSVSVSRGDRISFSAAPASTPTATQAGCGVTFKPAA